MKYVGYYNGDMGPLCEMTVPMGDRAIYFGDGCYDAAIYQDGVIFALEDHLDRFYNSLRLLEIPFAMDRETLTAELLRCIAAADDNYGLVYWQSSRGACEFRSHEYPDPKLVKPTLMIMVKPYDTPAKEFRARLMTAEDTRFLHGNIKTINLIPSVMASQHARERGCTEAVLHRGGVVTECAHSNVHILKDGVFRTHPADNLILPGIARKHLLELCAQLGIPKDETAFTVQEMLDADEVIISSSGQFCVGVGEIDGRPVGGRDQKTLRALQDAFSEKFLTYIHNR
jgi:D-alanine transaminase